MSNNTESKQRLENAFRNADGSKLLKTCSLTSWADIDEIWRLLHEMIEVADTATSKEGEALFTTYIDKALELLETYPPSFVNDKQH